MSSFTRYSMPVSVIHCAKKSPSSPMEQVSRNSQFIFPPEQIEGNFQDRYEHWFDFSRILLPATHFCCEQDRQRSTLEVGVCPPLIPADQMVQSQPCWTDFPRKRKRTTREEPENHANQDDKHPREEQLKREESEEEEYKSPKRKLILRLVQDKEKIENREWKSAKMDSDSKEVTSSVCEENKMDQSQPTDNKPSKMKLEEYLEKRRKNNASAKKSREARRMRELQTQIHAAYLEDENSKLRTIVGALRKENTHLRDLLIV
ncbi:transcription factor VBP-like [Actinia tenebrosa]|uniref:Transcription factor VBP-like n=1 Tax=Actinia tenebrosa TaxID=6105 RepID=A0A6P8H4X1_ACTTE|nr:transcription factor VBP-like [Actinia tenebrosa]